MIAGRVSRSGHHVSAIQLDVGLCERVGYWWNRVYVARPRRVPRLDAGRSTSEASSSTRSARLGAVRVKRAHGAARGVGDDRAPRPRRARRIGARSRRCTAARPRAATSAPTSPASRPSRTSSSRRRRRSRALPRRARRPGQAVALTAGHDDLAARPPHLRRPQPDGRDELDPGGQRPPPRRPRPDLTVILTGGVRTPVRRPRRARWR